jgi:hypothetical protein
MENLCWSSSIGILNLPEQTSPLDSMCWAETTKFCKWLGDFEVLARKPAMSRTFGAPVAELCYCYKCATNQSTEAVRKQTKLQFLWPDFPDHLESIRFHYRVQECRLHMHEFFQPPKRLFNYLAGSFYPKIVGIHNFGGLSGPDWIGFWKTDFRFEFSASKLGEDRREMLTYWRTLRNMLS